MEAFQGPEAMLRLSEEADWCRRWARDLLVWKAMLEGEKAIDEFHAIELNSIADQQLNFDHGNLSREQRESLEALVSQAAIEHAKATLDALIKEARAKYLARSKG